MPRDVPKQDNRTGPNMQGKKSGSSSAKGGGGPFPKKKYGNHKGGGGAPSVTQRLNQGIHHTTGKSG